LRRSRSRGRFASLALPLEVRPLVMQVTKLALVLWTTFISIPWMLKFPRMFAAFLAPAFTATVWLYILWRAGFPILVIIIDMPC
jgi:hypothetical protein